MQTRNIEARQPHVPNDDQLQRIVRILKAVLDVLPDFLSHQVPTVMLRIGGRSCHDNLDGPFGKVLAVPLIYIIDYVFIEIYTHPPAHTDDHSFTVHRFKPLLEMVKDVLSDKPQPFLCADHSLQP